MHGRRSIKDFKQPIFEHLALRKRRIILLSAFFLVALIVGVITISQLTKTFSIDNIMDLLLIKTFKNNISIISYFFRRFFDYIIISAVVFVLCLSFYTSFATVVVVVFRGFQIGVNTAIFCVVFGVGGVFNVLFVYLPIQLILHFVLINFCSICMCNSSERKRHGRRRDGGSWIFLIVFILIFLTLCLVESLLVPTLFKRIILTV